jgi:putative Mg2+ transporter-C (MgtC) family protein
MTLFVDHEVILRLLLATSFGAAVGVERYLHGRPAGLRTYLVVCAAFASIAVLSGRLSLTIGPAFPAELRPDPGRLMAGGLTGIGFLGAGIILRGGVMIHGLTTAAGIWGISVVGLAIGSGFYGLGTTLWIITLSSLMGLRHIERHLKRDTYKRLEVSIGRLGVSKESLERLCEQRGLRVVAVEVAENRSTHVLTYRMILNGRAEQPFHEAYQDLASIDDVQSIQLTGHSLG